MLKKVIVDERGQVLAWALVIMAIGALTIPPLLTRISANLTASRDIEEGLKEQYAADSGVEYATMQIRTGTFSGTWSYTINNKHVEVSWGEYITATYKITSTATSRIYGRSTRVESYISLNIPDYDWLLDNAITSVSDVELSPGSQVSGNVVYGGDLDNKGTITPPPGGAQDIDDMWPETSELAAFYFGQVQNLSPYSAGIIDIKFNNSIGPLRRTGDLNIISTQNNATAVLGGTVYITGDLNIGQTNQDFTLDLNGQAIYVEGDINIGVKCTLGGSGVIIAERDVFSLPQIQSSLNDFVFVMSTEGTLQMQPLGDFYGSVAGEVEVDLQPGSVLTWRDRAGLALNFPDGTSGTARIHTYHVYP